MKYTSANGKTINIPDAEIEKIAKGLDISIGEAVQVWLEDAEIELNEEQEELDKKAKAVKVSTGAETKRGRKAGTPRTVHVSDVKKDVFAFVKIALEGYCLNHNGICTVLNENKLITVEIDGKTIKIDLIEQKKKKNQRFWADF